MLSKFLQLVKQYQHSIFLGVCFFLISLISYNLGVINSGSENQIKITEGANIYQATKRQETGDQGAGDSQATPKTSPKPLDLRVVASRASDTKKYHYTWCGSWKRIKLENQIWFNSDREAEAAGYTLAGNCIK